MIPLGGVSRRLISICVSCPSVKICLTYDSHSEHLCLTSVPPHLRFSSSMPPRGGFWLSLSWLSPADVPVCYRPCPISARWFKRRNGALTFPWRSVNIWFPVSCLNPPGFGLRSGGNSSRVSSDHITCMVTTTPSGTGRLLALQSVQTKFKQRHFLKHGKRNSLRCITRINIISLGLLCLLL